MPAPPNPGSVPSLLHWLGSLLLRLVTVSSPEEAARANPSVMATWLPRPLPLEGPRTISEAAKSDILKNSTPPFPTNPCERSGAPTITVVECTATASPKRLLTAPVLVVSVANNVMLADVSRS